MRAKCKTMSDYPVCLPFWEHSTSKVPEETLKHELMRKMAEEEFSTVFPTKDTDFENHLLTKVPLWNFGSPVGKF